MERKRFSVLFFIKRSKLLKNGEAPVRVRVTYDRLYVELQLKRSIKVPLWSQEKEKSTGKDRNSVELNHYIDALRVKFYQIYQDLELEGKIISARAIVNRYQGKYLQPIITQYFIDNKSEIWLLFLIAHSKR